MAIVINGSTGITATESSNLLGNGVVEAADLASGAAVSNIGYTPANQSNIIGRNRIINGDFAIDQRYAGASVSGVAGAYTVDRWLASGSGGSLTVQRVAGTGAYAYDFQLTGASGITNSYVYQKIESVSCGGLANNDITIQAQLSSTTVTSVEVKVYIPTSANSFPGTYLGGTTITIDSTPTVYSWTVNAGANAGNGIQLQFDFGALISGTARISGVQLEAGSVATEFERRPYELALCQRYYEKSYNPEAAIASFSAGFSGFTTSSTTAGTIPCNLTFKVTKRGTPTVTGYNAVSGASGAVYRVSDANSISISSFGYIGFNQVGTINLASGSVNDYLFHWTASAEL